ncbi:hypothetical protein F2P56_012867, partial [Juglans regia]
ENRLAHSSSSKQTFEPSANYTTHQSSGGRNQKGGRSSFRGRQGRGRGNYSNRGRGNFSGNQQQTPGGGPRPTCQVCQKSGHVALQCRHRFDHSYQTEAPQFFSANYTTNYSDPNSMGDTTWYPDSAATHHITNNLSHLNLSSEQYTGNEGIRVGDGSCLPIQHIGQSDGDIPPHRSNP